MPASSENLSRKMISKLWDVNWGAMDVLIGGKSSIDLERIRFVNWQDATVFIKYYGFDPDDPDDARKIHGFILEAWAFIEKYLIPSEWDRGLKPPQDLLEYDDVRDVILAASDSREEKETKQAWACALLRVLHTIAHMEGTNAFDDFSRAREQIMKRFQQFIFTDAAGMLRFGTKELSVPLSRIEWKYGKPRNSVLLKLLHKKANVTETIYDFIGMRIITKNLHDVIIVVKFLRDHHMVTFANCNPSRARNSLLDIGSFRHNVESLKVLLDQEKISAGEFEDLLRQVTRPVEKKTVRSNPHSSQNYRSIQLTCRQLIRVPPKVKPWQKKIAELFRSAQDGEHDQNTLNLLAQITMLIEQDQKTLTEKAKFFPFEIQIMDETSFETNNSGSANHDQYKQSQIKSARRRILGKLLTRKYYRKTKV